MGVRSDAWRIYRDALPVLLIALAGGLFAGLILESLVERVQRFPGLLVMIPVFLATRGNVYGALGARIASGLHQGLIEPRVSWNERLVNAVLASIINGIGIAIVIALLTWVSLTALPTHEPAPLVELLAIMLVAGVLTSAVLVSGLVVLIFAGYVRGHDPDNIVGPIVTTLGDVFGMLFLFFAVWLVEVITL